MTGRPEAAEIFHIEWETTGPWPILDRAGFRIMPDHEKRAVCAFLSFAVCKPTKLSNG